MKLNKLIIIIMVILGIIQLGFSDIQNKKNSFDIEKISKTEILEDKLLIKYKFKEKIKKSKKNKKEKKKEKGTKDEKEIEKLKNKIDKKYKKKFEEVEEKIIFPKKYLKLKKNDLKSKKEFRNYPLFYKRYICEDDGDFTSCKEKWELLKTFNLEKENISIPLTNGIDYKLGNHSIIFTSGTYIEVLGNSTKGTQANPFTFEDIYQADLSGGWGCFIGKYKNNLYEFNGTKCSIRIGGYYTTTTYPTYFNDSDKTIIINIDIGTPQGKKVFIEQGCNTTIQLGRLDNFISKATSGGVQIKYNNKDIYWYNGWTDRCGGNDQRKEGIKTYLFSTSLTNIGNNKDITHSFLGRGGNLIYNFFQDRRAHVAEANVAGVFNFNSFALTPGFRRPDSYSVIDRVLALSNTYAVWFQIKEGSLKNLYTRFANYLAFMQKLQNSSFNPSITNFDTDIYKVKWNSDTYNNVTLTLYNELNLIVKYENGTPINSANVLIYQNNGTLFYNGTTNSSGQIPTQKLEWGHMINDCYPTTCIKNKNDWITNQTQPYTIIISKTNYVTQKMQLIPDKPKNLELSLKPKLDLITLFGTLLIKPNQAAILKSCQSI